MNRPALLRRSFILKEQWKPIPGFEGYDVSDRGRVRSYRVAGHANAISKTPQRTLKPSHHKRYAQVVLVNPEGARITRPLAPLVMLAFVGPGLDGEKVCHNDGNSHNDHLENLRYDSHSANLLDITRHGGERLTLTKVKAIRSDYEGGKPIRDIAGKFKISKWRASDVCLEKTYKIDGDALKKKMVPDKSVEAIRELCASGELSQAEIARIFGISQSTVSKIKHGLRRKLVERPIGQKDNPR